MSNPHWWARSCFLARTSPAHLCLFTTLGIKMCNSCAPEVSFFNLNGVYSMLWYPSAALLIDWRCVCLFICVHTWICSCFSCIFNIFRTPLVTGRNEARNLILNSRKGSILSLCFMQKYIFSNASGVKMLGADVFHLWNVVFGIARNIHGVPAGTGASSMKCEQHVGK